MDVAGGLVSEVRADTRCKSWFEKHIDVQKITLLNVSSRIYHSGVTPIAERLKVTDTCHERSTFRFRKGLWPCGKEVQNNHGLRSQPIGLT